MKNPLSDTWFPASYLANSPRNGDRVRITLNGHRSHATDNNSSVPQNTDLAQASLYHQSWRQVTYLSR